MGLEQWQMGCISLFFIKKWQKNEAVYIFCANFALNKRDECNGVL